MEDLLFYGIDLLVIVIMFGLLKNSKPVMVRTDAGSSKYITLILCAISLFLIIKEKSFFYFIQGSVVFIIGLCYLRVKSGFSNEGIVIMGKLYKRQNISELLIENQNNVFRVSFKYGRKPHYLYVNSGDIKKIETAVKEFNHK